MSDERVPSCENELYPKLIKVSDDYVDKALTFAQNLYFSEIERRRGLDTRARANFVFIAAYFAIIFNTNSTLFKFIIYSPFYFWIAIITLLIVFFAILLSAWAARLGEYKTAPINTIDDEQIIGYQDKRYYIICLIYAYYQCIIPNNAHDEKRAKILKCSQDFIFLGLFFSLVLCFGVVTNSPTFLNP